MISAISLAVRHVIALYIFLCFLLLVYKAGKFKVAKFQYSRIVEYLQFSDTLEGDCGIERDRLLLAAHLNSALCHLKLGNDVAARESANRALELDAKNEKALFRRGMVCSVLRINVVMFRGWWMIALCIKTVSQSWQFISLFKGEDRLCSWCSSD